MQADTLTASQIHDRIAALQSEQHFLLNRAKSLRETMPAQADKDAAQAERDAQEIAALAQSAEARG